MPDELPATTADLVKLVTEHLAKRSKSFVADGEVFARVIQDQLLPRIAHLEQHVTDLQAGQTRLTMSLRRLRRFRARVSRLRRRMRGFSRVLVEEAVPDGWKLVKVTRVQPVTPVED